MTIPAYRNPQYRNKDCNQCAACLRPKCFTCDFCNNPAEGQLVCKFKRCENPVQEQVKEVLVTDPKTGEMVKVMKPIRKYKKRVKKDQLGAQSGSEQLQLQQQQQQQQQQQHTVQQNIQPQVQVNNFQHNQLVGTNPTISYHPATATIG